MAKKKQETWAGIPVAVRKAIKGYAEARINLSWMGAAHPDSHEYILVEYKAAANKLKLVLKRHLKGG